MERWLHAARILLLVGGVIIVVWGLLVFVIAALLISIMAHGPFFGPLFAYVLWYGMVAHGAIMMALGVLAIVSAALVWGGSLHRVRAGSVMGLAIGVVVILLEGPLTLSLIGSLLLLIGGILGLVWKPTTTAQPAQQP